MPSWCWKTAMLRREATSLSAKLCNEGEADGELQSYEQTAAQQETTQHRISLTLTPGVHC